MWFDSFSALAPCEFFFQISPHFTSKKYIQLIEWTIDVRGGNGETTFKLSKVFSNHSPTGAPAPAKRLQRPGDVRRGLPIFTREGAMQEQW